MTWWLLENISFVETLIKSDEKLLILNKVIMSKSNDTAPR